MLPAAVPSRNRVPTSAKLGTIVSGGDGLTDRVERPGILAELRAANRFGILVAVNAQNQIGAADGGLQRRLNDRDWPAGWADTSFVSIMPPLPSDPDARPGHRSRWSKSG